MNPVSFVAPSPDYSSAQFRDAPIGVMDSGVGGLSILRELQRLLPNEDFVFFADQGHVPYGEKTLAQVREFTNGITRFFLSEMVLGEKHRLPVKLIVIACNTASAAALLPVRDAFPMIKFVGMEPAIKPAAEHTKTGVIGAIATKATFQGELYASLVDRYAQDIEVKNRACPEFVSLVERGGPYDAEDQAVVRLALEPLVEAGIDQLVLGCTHFPFLSPLIEKALQDMGAEVSIVDPSEAVARQTQRVLDSVDALNLRDTKGQTFYITSGSTDKMASQLEALLGISQAEVQHAAWHQQDLSLDSGR